MSREEPCHFFGGSQIAIGETLAAKAGIIDGAALTDAGHHILQHAALRRMVEHIAGRHRRNARGDSSLGQPMQTYRIPWPAAQGQRQISTVAEI